MALHIRNSWVAICSTRTRVHLYVVHMSLPNYRKPANPDFLSTYTSKGQGSSFLAWLRVFLSVLNHSLVTINLLTKGLIIVCLCPYRLSQGILEPNRAALT
ncbi:hypothetical protein BDV09DRAFT_162030 [Aspergillus tetrazonus]